MGTPSAWVLAARLQGVYYAVTGVWPVLHMASFLRVTGPKRDLWLVRTVGLVMGALGAGLVAAARGRRVDPALALASAAAAAGVAAVDLTPGPPARISRLYAADGVAQLLLLALWAAGARRRRADPPGVPADAGAGTPAGVTTTDGRLG
jgi:hypothetical protein